MDWRKALHRPYDPNGLTELMAWAWRDQERVESVSTLDTFLLRVDLKRDERKHWNVPLEPLWRMLEVNPDEPPEWQVQRFVQHWLSAFDMDLQVRPKDRLHFYPMLEGEGWHQSVIARDELAEPVTEGLWLAYQIEHDGGSFYLQHGHLKILGLRQRLLRHCALANLGRKYGLQPTWANHGPNIYSLGMGHSLYGAALLVDNGLWRGIQEQMQISQLLAAVPCQCHVFFTDAGSPRNIDAFMRKVGEVFDRTDSPLSPILLTRDADAWKPYQKVALASV